MHKLPKIKIYELMRAAVLHQDQQSQYKVYVSWAIGLDVKAISLENWFDTLRNKLGEAENTKI